MALSALVVGILPDRANAADPSSVESEFLAPQGILTGGFSRPPNALPGQGATGPFIKLMYPAALAANGPDLYVADIGARTLLHFDTFTRSVARLREVPALPGVRLEAARDGSVFVVAPGVSSIEQLARDGRRLRVFAEKFDVLQPADIVIAPGGEYWLTDSSGSMFAFHPSGRMAVQLGGRSDGLPDETGGATLLAAGRQDVFGLNASCRCVIVFDRTGNPLTRFGEGDLMQPIALAVDTYDRVWVVDAGDQRLKVFQNWQLAATLAPARLGLTAVTNISIDAFLAYVADGPGGKVGVFSVLPPAKP